MSPSYRYLILGCFESDDALVGEPIALYQVFRYLGIIRVISPKLLGMLSRLTPEAAEWSLKVLLDADQETETDDAVKIDEIFERLASLKTGPLRVLKTVELLGEASRTEFDDCRVFSNFLQECEGPSSNVINPRYGDPTAAWSKQSPWTERRASSQLKSF